MKAKFDKGQRVRVTNKNGETIDGIINDWDYNCCTFDVQYDIEYMKGNEVWTLMCVPENCIELL